VTYVQEKKGGGGFLDSFITGTRDRGRGERSEEGEERRKNNI